MRFGLHHDSMYAFLLCQAFSDPRSPNARWLRLVGDFACDEDEDEEEVCDGGFLLKELENK